MLAETKVKNLICFVIGIIIAGMINKITQGPIHCQREIFVVVINPLLLDKTSKIQSG
jgi:hypothetical protein